MNSITRKNHPLSMLKKLDTLGREGDLFSGMLDDLFHFHGFSPLSGMNNPDFSPALDIIDGKDKYSISLEVPGINKDNINIEIDDGIMTISGEKKSDQVKEDENRYVRERCYGAFRREFKLPSNSDVENISAGYDSGVLTLGVPKIVEETKEKKKICIT